MVGADAEWNIQPGPAGDGPAPDVHRRQNHAGVDRAGGGLHANDTVAIAQQTRDGRCGPYLGAKPARRAGKASRDQIRIREAGLGLEADRVDAIELQPRVTRQRFDTVE